MDKNKLKILLISGGMGLLAAILFYVYIQQEKARVVASIPVKPAVEEAYVVQATRDIPHGQQIDKNALALRKIPVNFIQPGALNSVEAAAGKIALVDISLGEQITANKFTSTKSSEGTASASLSMITPPGKRAITVPMDPLMAVGGMVRPGDYVDILANFPVPQEVAGKQTVQVVTVTLFQNVLVLAVGNQFREAAPTGGRGVRAEPAQPAQPAQTITFALSPQEAELISFAQKQGELKLILRPPLDTQVQSLPVASGETLWQYILATQGVKLQQAEQSSQQLQGKEEKPAAAVEIYHGGKK